MVYKAPVRPGRNMRMPLGRGTVILAALFSLLVLLPAGVQGQEHGTFMRVADVPQKAGTTPKSIPGIVSYSGKLMIREPGARTTAWESSKTCWRE